ncbi:MAG: hypothetical protein A3F26_03445 [Candidatus Ryanbacteria bacterium RIFCSPHIGHO2_12_FULL_47_12b]|uniref:Zinc finger DksA/TraR C4-type domain-containing protein n=2 Tax=Candidatus Ryaniibacteriota TaxID=1817914 RepID=A0A1G2H437_9BACT|nr:MAG: hypothetical protein UX74_C0022G0009 [Parcubacteria group bacterium GW2011_GWA2_47_10b]KKW02553.1 MAG: hypothetical protein UY36_C0006G0010 [Parcubacteria group bacterium GW2011_GWA1_49_11]OGZ46037.1 MAG: hypothetical protein A2844_02480 [Candidatus Ryanbacteria bacterium RIFCSPHIGHO2_01_FULL_48_80]OGZ48874.1 MAG: hypothetical protein A3C83_01350 [Candidatus Ryanbacteria bacterium RIFCSPHIGHO2_02_FULL_47_25]OGZ53066.1 MAG: hypothetical protein A3F26_03445 [Candidatus Ryanbacteria bacter
MNVKEFENLLLEEKKEIEKSLSSVGTQSIKNPQEWETKYPDLNVDPSDKSDMADEVEEFDNAIGIESALEEKLREINAALERVKNGTYGKCEKKGEDISEQRLRANPAARTCIEHSR